MKQPNSLIIANSFGGSFLFPAMANNIKVRAVFQQGEEGLPIQKYVGGAALAELTDKRTFTKLGPKDEQAPPPTDMFGLAQFNKTRWRWTTPNGPVQLSDSNVIGQLPTGPYAPTLQAEVLDYFFQAKVPVAAFEIIPRVFGVDDPVVKLAEQYGYGMYRVLLNSTLFGLSLNRKRMWMIFVAKGKKPLGDIMVAPSIKQPAIIGDVVKFDAPPPEDHVRKFKLFDDRVKDKIPDDAERATFWSGARDGYGKAADIGFGPWGSEWCRSAFLTAGGPVVMDPTRPALSLQPAAIWLVNGQMLPATDYCRLAGYPESFVDSLKDPDSKISQITKSQDCIKYLDEGVCPPVAEWILTQILYPALSEPEGEGQPAKTSALKEGEVFDMIALRDGERSSTPGVRKERTLIDYGFDPNAPEVDVYQPKGEDWI